MYFNTPILDYAKALLMWIVLMILTGLGVMILYGN
jgi:hypothetical protein